MSSEGTAILQIFQGIEALKAGREEESALKKQAGVAFEEGQAEGKRVQEESERLQTRQRLSFLKSGVSLQGSPLLAIARTEELGKAQADAIRNRGLAQSGLLRSKAKIAGRTGRAQFLGSAAQASATTAGGSFFQQAKEGKTSAPTKSGEKPE